MKKYLIYSLSLVGIMVVVIFGALIFLWALPNNVIQKPNQEMFNRSTQLFKHRASSSSSSVTSSSSSAVSAGDKVIKSLTGKTLDEANTYANKKGVQVIIMSTVKGTAITKAVLNSAGLLLYMN